MSNPKVANLTVDELRKLIREEVKQTLREIFADPDEDLELRDEFRSELERSLAEVEAGGKIISAQEVAAKLGLDWHRREVYKTE